MRSILSRGEALARNKATAGVDYPRLWLMERLHGLLERHAVSDGLQVSVAEEAQEAQGQAAPCASGTCGRCAGNGAVRVAEQVAGEATAAAGRLLRRSAILVVGLRPPQLVGVRMLAVVAVVLLPLPPGASGSGQGRKLNGRASLGHGGHASS